MLKKVLVFFLVIGTCFGVLMYFMITSEEIDFYNSTMRGEGYGEQLVQHADGLVLSTELDTLMSSKDGILFFQGKDSIVIPETVEPLLTFALKQIFEENKVLTMHVYYDQDTETEDLGAERAKRMLSWFTSRAATPEQFEILSLPTKLEFEDSVNTHGLELFLKDAEGI